MTPIIFTERIDINNVIAIERGLSWLEVKSIKRFIIKGIARSVDTHIKDNKKRNQKSDFLKEKIIQKSDRLGL